MPEKMRAIWKGTMIDELDVEGNKTGNRYPAEYISGVPAHSLTAVEYDALPDDLKAVLKTSPLYEVRSDREMSAKSDEGAH